MATEKKMTAAEIKATAKENVLNVLRDVLESNGAEMVGNTAYIPQTVGEQEVWVEVKQYTDTKVSKAFDPFVAREEYEEEQKIKRDEAEAKAKAKADKAKSKKSRSRKSADESEG